MSKITTYVDSGWYSPKELAALAHILEAYEAIKTGRQAPRDIYGSLVRDALDRARNDENEPVYIVMSEDQGCLVICTELMPGDDLVMLFYPTRGE